MLKAEARREIDLTEDYKGVKLFSNLIGSIIGPTSVYSDTSKHTRILVRRGNPLDGTCFFV
ncbi:hypothetical protein C7R92_11000 [Brevibacillus porteri]|uniref:Uncharacterized protein n=1 Tax=Brevibacillus porteri TaxID=2126350 RepID=A0ABX5FR70_9BACL|nr:hypothetical protein C7R92_11000 [Brevibacillus porteri]